MTSEAFQELFLATGAEPPNAVNWAIGAHGPTGSLYQHISNFSTAVDALGARIDSGDDNEMVFPWVAMARHTVELAMKECCQEAMRLGIVSWTDLIGRDCPGMEEGKLWTTHDLRLLARLVTNFISKAGGEAEAKTWRRHAAFLNRWEEADPGGVIFRYARSSDGTAISTQATGPIDEQPDGMQVWPSSNITHKRIENRYHDAVAFLVDGILTGFLAEVEDGLAQATEAGEP